VALSQLPGDPQRGSGVAGVAEGGMGDRVQGGQPRASSVRRAGVEIAGRTVQ
jgi:hypothetical protein